MDRIKFPASSLVEAIVASLIFLLVFVASLSTLAGFTLRKNEGIILLEAEHALTICLEQYNDGTIMEGTYTDSFEWGEITTVVTAYNDYENVMQAMARVRIIGSRKTIEQRMLVIKKDE